MNHHCRCVLAAATILVLLAGCVSPDSGDDAQATATEAGHVSQDILPSSTRAVVTNETGGVEGVVTNDVGARLGGAHVSLLGTPHSTRADSRGEFSISDIQPGDVTMRVDMEPYRPIEQTIPILAAKVTRVNVTLVPLVDSGAGYRDHLHDLWGGVDREVLYEGELRMRYSTGCARVQGVITVNGEACYQIAIPTDSLVKPGTDRLEITVKWNTEYVPKVRFDYQPANHSAFLAGPELTPGQPAVLPLNPIMTDHGHARFTMWSMRLYAPTSAANGDVRFMQNDVNDRLVGAFQTVIVAYKGEIPGEPAHERFWANGSRIEFGLGERTINSFPRARSPSLTACSNTTPCWVFPNGIVPPGTTRVEVTLTYGPDATFKPAWDVLAKRKSLSFRTSDVNPKYATWDNLRYDKATTNERGKVVYELKLDPEDADAFYQKRSNWLFLLGNEGEERNENYVDDCPGYVGGCPGVKYQLSVAAINDDWTPELAG